MRCEDDSEEAWGANRFLRWMRFYGYLQLERCNGQCWSRRCRGIDTWCPRSNAETDPESSIGSDWRLMRISFEHMMSEKYEIEFEACTINVGWGRRLLHRNVQQAAGYTQAAWASTTVTVRYCGINVDIVWNKLHKPKEVASIQRNANYWRELDLIKAVCNIPSKVFLVNVSKWHGRASNSGVYTAHALTDGSALLPDNIVPNPEGAIRQEVTVDWENFWSVFPTAKRGVSCSSLLRQKKRYAKSRKILKVLIVWSYLIPNPSLPLFHGIFRVSEKLTSLRL